jgi:hypothetical protein
MNQMSIRVSDGPADELVRLHTEHTDWDAPDVRYLRRRPPGIASTLGLHTASNDRVVFVFGSFEVTVRAVEDHIEIVLRPIPPGVAQAA